MADIRVSGYTSPRARLPLLDPSGNPTIGFLGTTILVNALLDPNNFGTGGVVPCPVTFLPFVQTVETGSLVDSNGNLKVDLFFIGITGQTLSPIEADELAAFVNAGGILYLGGDSGVNEGQSYNPLFAALGTTDVFSQTIVPIPAIVQTSVPLASPVTNGPFGIVGPLSHETFRVFFPGTGTTGIAFGDGTGSIILAEGAFGLGYISAAGDPIYVNEFLNDTDNINYFLNLFALACLRAGQGVGSRGVGISRLAGLI